MRRDLVSSVFWLAVAIFAAVAGHSLGLGSLNRPGPGFFPFWGGVTLALLSLVLLVSSRGRPAARPPAPPSSAKPLAVAGALLAYLLLLEWLGFAVVTFLFLGLLFRLERRGWAFSAASAAVGTLACYALFQLWLKTQLPAGPLGF
jgi:putative tricarboxylic transport membrane protein